MLANPVGSEGTFSRFHNCYMGLEKRWQDVVGFQSVLAVVVEDEWSIRMQIVDTLADAGWEVEEFTSAERAIEYLDNSTVIGLLVTDIRLTGSLTGWDVAEAYRNANAEMKILYCSGNPPDQSRQVAGSKFMEKPCHMEDLLKAVTA